MDALFTSHAADVYAFASAADLSVGSAGRRVGDVSRGLAHASIRFPRPPSRGSLASPVVCWRTSVATDSRQIALRTRLGSTQPSRRRTTPNRLAEPAAPTGDSTVLAALGALTPAERDAITLVAWDGLTAEEAAIVLGCSRAAFYVRVHRARRRLAAALGTAIDPSNEQEADPS